MAWAFLFLSSKAYIFTSAYIIYALNKCMLLLTAVIYCTAHNIPYTEKLILLQYRQIHLYNRRDFDY